MLLLAAAFAGGVIILQWCAGLPPLWAYSVVPLALISLGWRSARLPAVFILGFFWAALLAEQALDPALDPALEGKTILVEGRVLDRPRQITQRQSRFLFYIERLDAGQGWSDFQGKARLSIYSADFRVASGERWQLAVRLKRPHGFSNPGGFDFEQWLFQQGIRATGYVRQDKARNRLLAVTGAAVLADAWYHHKFLGGEGEVVASPALIKAMLVASADNLVGGEDHFDGSTLGNSPSVALGWGRVNLDDWILYPKCATISSLYVSAQRVSEPRFLALSKQVNVT